MTLKNLITLAAGCVLISQPINAQSFDYSVPDLGKELTPYGALQQGNGKEIPAWTGGIQNKDWPKSYTKSGQHHPDPFADDKPLYTINAQNMDQYADILTEGHKALLKTYPKTFTMPVYPTRRSHSAPQRVYDNIEKNAQRAELVENGLGIKKAFGGVAFPLPYTRENQVDPNKVVWNHITRYRGDFVLRDAAEVAVHRDGDYQLVSSVQEVFFDYYAKDKSWETLDNKLFHYLSITNAPARLAGAATLIHEPLNQLDSPRQAWKYNTGQRKVLRAPSLAFDAPIAAADGLRTADDTDIFNGSLERYNWQFMGRKEMLIAYNSYQLDDPSITYKQLLQKGHVASEFTRYELHRVWIVEGTLKEDSRHIYGKRRFYIDEDSWSIAVADQYDVRGQLWRVSVAYLKNYYDLPTTWSALDVFHDLQAKRYHVQFLDNESDKTLQFSDKPQDTNRFSPNALRRMGRR